MRLHTASTPCGHRGEAPCPISSQGLSALADGLRQVSIADEVTSEVRNDLLYGAYLAGTAFATAGSGLHHKICHVLGGALDLPHAMTHAIVLPYVLAFNAPAAPEAAARIARALDVSDATAGLRSLNAAVGVPDGLRDLGMPRDRIDELADLVVEIAPADNPSPPTQRSIRALLHAAWTG